MERIYIREIMKFLNYKDRRSCRRWCGKNHVGILRDPGSNKLYVLKDEFEKALNKETERYLKEKYGKIDFHGLFNSITVEMKNTNENRKKADSLYKPMGQHEKSFLTSLLNATTEL